MPKRKPFKIDLLKILTALGSDDGAVVHFGIVGLLKLAANRCEAHGYGATRVALALALKAADDDYAKKID